MSVKQGSNRNPPENESAQQAEALRSALGVLTARERRVFEARRLSEDPPSLEELGRELSISGERVRQIETFAFEKVRRTATRHLRSAAVPAGELAG